MSLGSKIRELRIKKGLAQSDLVSGLVTLSMVSQIESEKANPSYKVLEAIAARLEEPLECFTADLGDQAVQWTAYRVAQALMASHAYDHAIELLVTLLKNPSADLNVVGIKAELAKCLVEVGKYDEASGVLQEGI